MSALPRRHAGTPREPGAEVPLDTSPLAVSADLRMLELLSPDQQAILLSALLDRALGARLPNDIAGSGTRR